MRWDTLMRPQYSRVQALDDRRAGRFATACLDHALWRLLPYYEAGVPTAQLAGLLDGVRALWALVEEEMPATPQIGEALAEKVVELASDEDTPDAAPGWSDLVFGVVAATYCFRGKDVHKRAFDAAGGAYLALYKKEIYPMRERGWKDADYVSAEAACRPCNEEISFQIDLLKRIEAGERPGSMLFASG